MEEWHRQKTVQDDPNASKLELAFSTFFLNRTNRSGIIRGGVIGGKKQRGRWTLDARFNADDLVRRIRLIARSRSRITLLNQDGITLAEQDLKQEDSRSLVYFDPPYFGKGSDLYQNYFVERDHAKLAEAVRELPLHWVVSYDAVSDVEALYSGFARHEYGIHYSAAQRYETGGRLCSSLLAWYRRRLRRQ